MSEREKKTEKVRTMVGSPWVSIKGISGGWELTGMTKSDVVKLNEDEAVQILADLLKDENSLVRSGAIRILGEIGEKAAVTAPTLVKMIREYKDEEGRVLLVNVLRKIGAVEVLQGLAETMKNDENYKVRFGAACALGELLEKAPEKALLGLLEARREDEHWSVVCASAAEELRKIWEKAVDSPPLHFTRVQISEPEVMGISQEAAIVKMELKNLQKKVKKAVSTLVKTMKDDKNPSLRTDAKRALVEIATKLDFKSLKKFLEAYEEK